MKVVVQKFGGTSVRDEISRSQAIKHIQLALGDGYKVVVVVSAMGRLPDAYATDALLALVDYPNHAISNREYDLLLSCGEVLSAVVFSNQLKKSGILSTALTGVQAGFLTTDDFTQAKIIEMDTTRLKEELTEVDVVVVTGFQGQTKTGDITTLGRGGSDTSAAALGASLNAEYVDIFTDVDGIKTADPRIVPGARTLDVVTYSEIVNLAYQGAKVVHPRAVEIAMQAKVPLRVRSTASSDVGTLVTGSINQNLGRDINDRLITGIAHIAGIAQIKIETEADMTTLHADVFGTLADAGISVDFINMFPGGLRFTVPDILGEKALDIIEKLGYQPTKTAHCAKVSVVGAGMTGVPGVTARIVRSLKEQNITILQSADSHTTIWVLVKEEEVNQAVNALHEAFELTEKSWLDN
ncbi:aspartokinase [Halolactibacillus alkaliphilus]|uniref:Aspartokinase n=1 Tax=Halolactibacillus alkaliphilus TaxID=442899 RepID=A0A511X4C3_9BACI|nr:aspartate kinase [Halolactibacillus alkaliphilus]GEN57797.1 aspartokinase [Halolactibacillus alkaliphilus]GGN75105.1 aspartokinase [Halolactibacillus alkaliphilus]SFP05285.1 aspartate kinase [Halolactibacillus alkaliphilus]